MSKIGEIKRAQEIGRNNRQKYIWLACEDCRKERWVLISKGAPNSRICRACQLKSIHKSGELHHNWKGGKGYHTGGYIQVLVGQDDFFAPMRQSKGYVLEHRLVVAKALGRCLLPWEIVHHKEGFAKDDNRYPETLQLVSDDRHKQITILERRIKLLEKRITLLTAERGNR